jgi:hypothetical protein
VRNIADISVVASPTFMSKAGARSTISTERSGCSRRRRMAAEAPEKAPPRITTSKRRIGASVLWKPPRGQGAIRNGEAA